MSHNPEHSAPLPLPSWLFLLGGALVAVGAATGYIARAPVASRSDQHSVNRTHEERGLLPHPAATEAHGAARVPETAASLPSPVPSVAPEQLSAKEARDREVARLASSGPDRRNLTADALRAGESWSRAVKKEGLDLRFDHWTCYRAGCVTDVHHAPELFERLSRAVSTDSAFMGWAGPKMRSGPIELPSGEIEVTWILYAPADNEPALAMEQDPGPEGSPATQDETPAEMEKR